MKTLPGVGVFGTGSSARVLVPLLQAEGFTVEALWGKTEEEAKQLAEEMSIGFYTSRTDDVLLHQDVDLVCVNIPPPLTRQIAVKALGEGLAPRVAARGRACRACVCGCVLGLRGAGPPGCERSHLPPATGTVQNTQDSGLGRQGEAAARLSLCLSFLDSLELTASLPAPAGMCASGQEPWHSLFTLPSLPLRCPFLPAAGGFFSCFALAWYARIELQDQKPEALTQTLPFLGIQRARGRSPPNLGRQPSGKHRGAGEMVRGSGTYLACCRPWFLPWYHMPP